MSEDRHSGISGRTLERPLLNKIKTNKREMKSRSVKVEVLKSMGHETIKNV